MDGFIVNDEDVKNLATWDAKNVKKVEIPFKPARVVLQDFTGVPAIVDLAAMREKDSAVGRQIEWRREPLARGKEQRATARRSDCSDGTAHSNRIVCVAITDGTEVLH